MSDAVIIDLRPADQYRQDHYGVMFEGRTQHDVTGPGVHNRGYPHRVHVWGNTHRRNPHPGEVRWLSHGSIGGDGQYLDPHNRGTDDETTVLLSAESVVIAAHYTVQDIEDRRQGDPLAIGSTVRLRYPDGTLSDPYRVTVVRRAYDPELVPVR